MALTFSLLFSPVQLPAVTGDIFNMPATPATAVLKNARVRLVNTSASPVPVTLYAVPSGGTAGPDNCCLSAHTLGGNSYLDLDVPSLGAGGRLRGFAGAAGAVTVHELGGAVFS